jgi:hypothetical protein
MSTVRQAEHGGKLRRLLRLEWDSPADDDQLSIGGVEAGDDDFGVGDGS